MPSSTNRHISFIIDKIREIQPASVLDCGVGCGKWGFICREYLEIYRGRVFPAEWKILIEGIEVFEPYVCKLPWLMDFYNQIYIEDLRKMLPVLINKNKKYDLVIAGDVIEHLPKEAALECINNINKLGKYVILSIPLGKEWLDNKIVAGNKYEKHLSWWTEEELLNILPKTTSIFRWEEAKGFGAVFVYKTK